MYITYYVSYTYTYNKTINMDSIIFENIQSKFTVVNIKNFLRSNLDGLNDVDDDEYDYTSCWNGARYLFYLSELKYTDSITDYPDSIEKNDIYEFFSKITNKVLHCFIENGNIHHFTIYVCDDYIILLSTYGGQRRLTNNKFNKEMYTKMLQDFNGELTVYKKLFDIDKCTVNDLINFKEIKYRLV